ncbi:dicarboxylate/amino acid:cation symporter [Rickettsiales bacterium]|nr:dicarboxylate/amino acid:cation symporter [Rickettsiales bacterium]
MSIIGSEGNKDSTYLKTGVLYAMFAGIALGVLYRIFPNAFDSVFLSPTNFKFLGSVFIRLIRMIVSPLVFTSICVSIISMGDIRKSKKLFILSTSTFLIMTFISVLIGLFISHYFQIGNNPNIDITKILNSESGSSSHFMQHASKLSSADDFVQAIVPGNFFKPFITDNFLHVVFLALSISFGCLLIGPKSAPFLSFIESFNSVLMKLSLVFNGFAPFAVFGLSFWLVGKQDLSLLMSLGKLILCIYASCAILIYIINPIIILLFFRINPFTFIRKMSSLQLLSFLLASGSAVLPEGLRVAKEKLGVMEKNANFIIPIGATLNMTGGAIYISTATIFICQLFKIDLTAGKIVILVILSIVSAVGTAPVPGSAIFLLAGVLLSLEIPVDIATSAIGIVFAVDRILDMARTCTNVTGDILSAVLVSRIQGELNIKEYNAK